MKKWFLAAIVCASSLSAVEVDKVRFMFETTHGIKAYESFIESIEREYGDSIKDRDPGSYDKFGLMCLAMGYIDGLEAAQTIFINSQVPKDGPQ